jgi:hypothetical protein
MLLRELKHCGMGDTKKSEKSSLKSNMYMKIKMSTREPCRSRKSISGTGNS